MQRLATLANHQPICFRRWSRKNYAIFASLHKHVNIGVLSISIIYASLLKQGIRTTLPPFVQAHDSTEYADIGDDPPPATSAAPTQTEVKQPAQHKTTPHHHCHATLKRMACAANTT